MRSRKKTIPVAMVQEICNDSVNFLPIVCLSWGGARHMNRGPGGSQRPYVAEVAQGRMRSHGCGVELAGRLWGAGSVPLGGRHAHGAHPS